jgi:hypothetical protein
MAVIIGEVRLGRRTRQGRVQGLFSPIAAGETVATAARLAIVPGARDA